MSQLRHEAQYRGAMEKTSLESSKHEGRMKYPPSPVTEIPCIYFVRKMDTAAQRLCVGPGVSRRHHEEVQSPTSPPMVKHRPQQDNRNRIVPGPLRPVGKGAPGTLRIALQCPSQHDLRNGPPIGKRSWGTSPRRGTTPARPCVSDANCRRGCVRPSRADPGHDAVAARRVER